MCQLFTTMNANDDPGLGMPVPCHWWLPWVLATNKANKWTLVKSNVLYASLLITWELQHTISGVALSNGIKVGFSYHGEGIRCKSSPSNAVSVEHAKKYLVVPGWNNIQPTKCMLQHTLALFPLTVNYINHIFICVFNSSKPGCLRRMTWDL